MDDATHVPQDISPVPTTVDQALLAYTAVLGQVYDLRRQYEIEHKQIDDSFAGGAVVCNDGQAYAALDVRYRTVAAVQVSRLACLTPMPRPLAHLVVDHIMRVPPPRPLSINALGRAYMPEAATALRRGLGVPPSVLMAAQDLAQQTLGDSVAHAQRACAELATALDAIKPPGHAPCRSSLGWTHARTYDSQGRLLPDNWGGQPTDTKYLNRAGRRAAAINMEMSMYPDTRGVPPAIAEELALEKELGGPRPEPLPLNAAPDAEPGTPYRDIPVRQVVDAIGTGHVLDDLAPATPGPIPDAFKVGQFVCLKNDGWPYVITGAAWRRHVYDSGYEHKVMCDLDGVGHPAKLGTICTTQLRPWLSTVTAGSQVRVMEPDAKTPTDGYYVRCVNPNGTYDLNTGTAMRTGVLGSWLVPFECVPSTDV